MFDVNQMYVDEVYEIFNKKDNEYVFIDVRQPEEWEIGVIPGVEKIPLGELEYKLEGFDKEKKYVIVCRSGARSDRAAAMMLENGFKDVSNFQGGMLSWYDNEYPIEVYE